MVGPMGEILSLSVFAANDAWKDLLVTTGCATRALAAWWTNRLLLEVEMHLLVMTGCKARASKIGRNMIIKI